MLCAAVALAAASTTPPEFDWVTVERGNCVWDRASRTLTSPYYPYAYGDNENCFIKILRPLILTVQEFETERGFDSFWIHRTDSFGTSHWAYSGDAADPNDTAYHLNNTRLTAYDRLEFTSDASTRHNGFRIRLGDNLNTQKGAYMPTGSPSRTPSTGPTSGPSGEPTTSPSSQPTTARPTARPSAPTMPPTYAPSFARTITKHTWRHGSEAFPSGDFPVDQFPWVNQSSDEPVCTILNSAGTCRGRPGEEDGEHVYCKLLGGPLKGQQRIFSMGCNGVWELFNSWFRFTGGPSRSPSGQPNTWWPSWAPTLMPSGNPSSTPSHPKTKGPTMNPTGLSNCFPNNAHIGQLVGRGAYWRYGNQDGGTGHYGRITGFYHGSDKHCGRGELVWVEWDAKGLPDGTGQRVHGLGVYSAGCDGRIDLRDVSGNCNLIGTGSPSPSPTQHPTLPPSQHPTATPTEQPSRHPTVPPSIQPSSGPETGFPTGFPSRFPRTSFPRYRWPPWGYHSGFPSGYPSRLRGA
eukprot:TRINITY_DN5707_c0_g4_i1.p1 TRINITY_DN5707_c0_g4~~TRINITY_DN5707_c0_g4_i1.p1  ORF type:complete len:519 (+),score=45.33 TRINITY_DN5707_c0_g4_i1:84-1640(+)